MSKVQVIGTIPADPQAVWDVVGDFGAIAKWHPAIAESRAEGAGPGALRRLTLVNGDRLVERLEEFNDGERYYSYSLVEGPLPVGDYYATLHVRAAYDAPSSTIEWTGAFTAKDVPDTEAERLIQSIYQAGIDNLRQLLAAKPRS
ncbi:MAG TPA: SRPBCC family protein [Stellaceae bacterium]|nr:SRPBCC family protein [Stellaceae bacterium]